MFSRFLVILPMENIICWDMLFSNKMQLMFMSSHHRVIFLYLSKMHLGTFGTMIGSTSRTLGGNVLLYKCRKLDP